ncbi:MAG: LamG domain-containing protein [Ignavibacteriae bacterium]|nr:LamG domain-containing protein [Ignavibacteriota bacterium]
MTVTAIRRVSLVALLVTSFTFTASRAAVQKADTLQVSVSLRDGSRIIGNPTLDSIGLQTRYAALRIPLRLINLIEFTKKESEAILSLSSGEKLMGTVTPGVFPVRSLVGVVSIRQDDISTIVLLQKMSLSDSGLIAFYPLHGDAKDKTAHGYDGTVRGAEPCVGRSIIPNSAYCFDGKDAHITIPDGIIRYDTPAFSLSVWLLTPRMDKQSIALYLGAAEGEAVIQTMHGRLNFSLIIANAVHSASAELPVNVWTHVVGVYRRGERAEIWINGERKGETSLPEGDLTHGFPEHHSAIGSYAPAQVAHKRGFDIRNWLGSIADVRIYTRTLAPEEIQSLYAADH